MNKNFGISSRATGKINEKGELSDYKLTNYDFVSLYPNIMKKYDILPDGFEKILKRKERKEKLEKLNEICDEDNNSKNS